MIANNTKCGGTFQSEPQRVATHVLSDLVNACALTDDGAYICQQCWEGPRQAAEVALRWIEDEGSFGRGIVTVVLALPRTRESRRYEPTNEEHLAALRAMAGR